MMCSICRQGETQPGTTTVTLERGELTFVAKDVPAMVCANCGEEYLDSSTTAATDPKIRAFRDRIAEAQRDPTSDAVASDARVRR